MSAEIPQNQTAVTTRLYEKTGSLGTLESVCAVVQDHEEKKISSQQPPMSDPSFPSQSLNQDQISDMGRGTSQRRPQEDPGQRDLFLQLQMKQFQRVLQEQNVLLSLISPGLMLSPTFLAHWQARTPSRFPDTDPGCLAENLAAFNLSKPSFSDADWIEPEALTINNSNEHRCLSPIKEEFSETSQEECPLSPFGSRQNVPANPEERPIRPGLKEKQKTFEDFVEEHLKIDQGVFPQEVHASAGVKRAEKRNFLRKGEGISRIGKGHDSQKTLKTDSYSPQVMNMWSNQSGELQQTCKMKAIPKISHTEHRSSPGPKHSLPNTKKVGNLVHQRSTPEETVSTQDKNIQGQTNNKSSNDKGKVQTSDLLKKKHSSETLNNFDKNSQSKSQINGFNKNSTNVSQAKENVAFKKINDHIVKVNGSNGFTPNTLCNQSEYIKDSPKGLSLNNELTHLVTLSDSNDSTSSEDGPKSQSHRLLPYYPSRHADHKDQSLDLSEDDYASDAPSETEMVRCLNKERRTSTPDSSLSSSCSDSELQNLYITNRALTTEDKLVQSGSKKARENSEFTPPTPSQPLGKRFPKVEVNQKDSTHSMELKNSQAFIREKMEQYGFNGEIAYKPEPKHEDDTSDLYDPQDLRQQISSLKQQLMERESQWSQTHNLLKSRVEALTRQNQELHSKISSEKSREEPEKKTHIRSATPAFNKPSIHMRKSLPGRMTNGHTAAKDKKITEYTTHSLRKNSAHSSCSMDSDVPENNGMIPQSKYGGKGSLFNHNADWNNVPIPPQAKEDKVREEIRYPDGRVERLFSNGCRVIAFRNGTKKEIGVDKSVTVTFYNGDVKRILADGTVIYHYYDAQTTHSTYPSGLEVVQFPNNQKEKHHPNGTREIVFPDGTVKKLYPDGREESVFPDGTVVKISKHGEKTVEFTNGQREIHTSQYKRRMYPDGTIKTVYTNGRQETKFSSGRVRIKNNEGTIIMDKK